MRFFPLTSAVIACAALSGWAGAAISDLVPGVPDRLTLSFVLEIARKSSAAFRAVDALEISADAPRLQAEGPLLPKLSIGVRRLDDRMQPANPFSPRGTEAAGYFARVEKGLSLTGTRLALELQHARTELDFPTSPLAPYFETRFNLTASQSIWQGLVRGADRKRALAGRAGSAASTLARDAEHDQATLELIALYYRAWLAQADVRAAQANTLAKQRLQDVTRLRARRGTAERPDQLHAESGLKSAQNQADQAGRALQDVWESLIISLALPRELLAVDPLIVPVDLDDPAGLARARCRASADAAPALAHRLAQARAEAAEAQAESLTAATSAFDLVATGSYGANGIDNLSRSQTWSTALGRDYRAWSLEIAAQIPLGPSALEGDRRVQAADAIRARAAADQQRDQETIDRLGRCRAHELAETAHARAIDIFRNQDERLRLEERRFSLGRSSVTQVVMASDDRVIAERGLRQSEVDRRLAAWEAIGIQGGLFEAATRAGTKPTGEKPQ